MSRPLPKQDDRQTEALREDLGKVARDLKAMPFADGNGRLFKDIELAGPLGVKTIYHGFKRKPRGWLLLSIRATASISVHTPRESSRSESTLVLVNDSATTVTFDVWVY